MEQDIRFCKTSDGVRIAYAVTGGGPPLVRSLGWFTHLEHEWETPYFGPFNQILSQHYTLVRYDGRGMGLSDRNTADFSLEAKVKDLEAVIDGAGIDRCAIMGLSEGGPTAVAYAVKHPDRVSRLVLYGSNPSFNQMAETSEGRQLADAMINLARVGWGSDHPSYRQFFTAMFMPDAPAEALRTFSQYQRASAPPESVVAMIEALIKFDVRDLAPQVSVPTLVIHRRGDTAVPFESGREFAALIPGARFLPLEGRNHIFMPDEPEAAPAGSGRLHGTGHRGGGLACGYAVGPGHHPLHRHGRLHRPHPAPRRRQSAGHPPRAQHRYPRRPQGSRRQRN